MFLQTKTKVIYLTAVSLILISSLLATTKEEEPCEACATFPEDVIQEEPYIPPSPVEEVVENPGRIKEPTVVYGHASWYGYESCTNSQCKTASGEIFDENAMTAAYWDSSLGSSIKVTNVNNGKSVIVKVNDHGGFKKLGRIIDLSKGAFSKIGLLSNGIISVKIEQL